MKHTAAQLLAASRALDTPKNCMRCARAFGEEVIFRRPYSLGVGIAVASLCGPCDAALSPGSAADLEFQQHLEGQALASALPGGRA
jgi:hypothetical protein